jgi:hypothetical protein
VLTRDGNDEVPCLVCGHDLRGHDGDPIPCPECGGANAHDDLGIAATRTDEDYKEFETGPTSEASISCKAERCRKEEAR